MSRYGGAAANIVEINSENRIGTTLSNFSNDKRLKNLESILPDQSCVAFIVGRAGSGKSTLLQNLFCVKNRAYHKRFDRVYMWGNSFKSAKRNPFKKVTKTGGMFEELTAANFTEVLSQIANTGDRVALILDDVISEFQGNVPLVKAVATACRNRRHLSNGEQVIKFDAVRHARFPHYNRPALVKKKRITKGVVYIFITSQSYRAIPKQLRRAATFYCLFALNQLERFEIWEEVGNVSRATFFAIVRAALKHKYDLLSVDLTVSDPQECYARNWNRLQWTEMPDDYR